MAVVFGFGNFNGVLMTNLCIFNGMCGAVVYDLKHHVKTVRFSQ